MKILIVHQFFLEQNDAGGSRFNEFSRFWEEMGHEVTVIAGMVHYTTGKKNKKYKGKFIVKEKISEKITVIRTHVSESYNKSFLGRLWGYFAFTVSSTIAATFYTEKHDIVLVTSPPLFVGITGYFIKLLKRIPLVFEIRDLWPDSAVDIGALNSKSLIGLSYWLEKFIYKKSDMINVLTPAFKDILVKNKGVPEDKIIVITNGADLDIMTPGNKDNWVRDRYGLGNKFVALYMGAHGVANHLITLVETANKLKYDENICLMLVGDGMEKSMLKSKAEEYGLTNIIFVDSQPKTKIGDFCNASDVCLAVLKRVDTFKTVYPNKVFDYMSCKKPIIIAIDGAARTLVEEGDCGIYVEPENVEELSSALVKLKNDPELCSNYGNNGYDYVIKKFSRKSLAKEYEDSLIKLTLKEY